MWESCLRVLIGAVSWACYLCMGWTIDHLCAFPDSWPPTTCTQRCTRQRATCWCVMFRRLGRFRHEKASPIRPGPQYWEWKTSYYSSYSNLVWAPPHRHSVVPQRHHPWPQESLTYECKRDFRLGFWRCYGIGWSVHGCQSTCNASPSRQSWANLWSHQSLIF